MSQTVSLANAQEAIYVADCLGDEGSLGNDGGIMTAQVDYRVADRDTRPWGEWEVLAVGDGFAVKRIQVDPGHILSLQYHHHRAEHWILLTGEAEVTLDDQIFRIRGKESVYIPTGSRHRIANPGAEPLVFVEVQVGERLSEDDIVRLSDRYGRTEG